MTSVVKIRTFEDRFIVYGIRNFDYIDFIDDFMFLPLELGDTLSDGSISMMSSDEDTIHYYLCHKWDKKFRRNLINTFKDKLIEKSKNNGVNVIFK